MDHQTIQKQKIKYQAFCRFVVCLFVVSRAAFLFIYIMNLIEQYLLSTSKPLNSASSSSNLQYFPVLYDNSTIDLKHSLVKHIEDTSWRYQRADADGLGAGLSQQHTSSSKPQIGSASAGEGDERNPKTDKVGGWTGKPVFSNKVGRERGVQQGGAGIWRLR